MSNHSLVARGAPRRLPLDLVARELVGALVDRTCCDVVVARDAHVVAVDEDDRAAVALQLEPFAPGGLGERRDERAARAVRPLERRRSLRPRPRRGAPRSAPAPARAPACRPSLISASTWCTAWFMSTPPPAMRHVARHGLSSKYDCGRNQFVAVDVHAPQRRRARANVVAHRGVALVEAELEADLQHAFRVARVLRERVALVGGRRDRLLAVHVHARVERGAHELVRAFPAGVAITTASTRAARVHRPRVGERRHFEVGAGLLGDGRRRCRTPPRAPAASTVRSAHRCACPIPLTPTTPTRSMTSRAQCTRTARAAPTT